MKHAKKAFYERYLHILNQELRIPDNPNLVRKKVIPKSIFPLSSDYPIWSFLYFDLEKNQTERIYIIIPFNYKNGFRDVEILYKNLDNNTETEICVLIYRKIEYFLYI